MSKPLFSSEISEQPLAPAGVLALNLGETRYEYSAEAAGTRRLGASS